MAYLAFRAPAGSDFNASCYLKNGRRVPCSAYPLTWNCVNGPLDSVTGEKIFVVVLPLLTEAVNVAASIRGKTLSAGISPVRMKFQSRLLSLRRPDLAKALRGSARRSGSSPVQLDITDALVRDENYCVYRLVAHISDISSTDDYLLKVFDANLSEIDTVVHILEDHNVPLPWSHHLFERLVTFSVEVPRSYQQLVFSLTDSDTGTQLAFTCSDCEKVSEMLELSRWRAAAEPSSYRYEEWLESHRITSRELRLQVDSSSSRDPKVSVFSVDSGNQSSTDGYLNRSFAAQSYQNCELIDVVPSTSANSSRPLFEEALASSNGDIIVIGSASTAIEPDALWQLAHAINDGADAAYVDEDILVNNVHCLPSFKTMPDIFKLESFDYVSDIIAIRRDVFEFVLSLGPLERRAWHYDLCLRLFAEPISIAHISRQLCHRSASVSFDIDAARQSLKAHLSRHNIQADVIAGPVPGSFRLAYTLGEALPKVSVIIPTRDHADLLRTCVNSILELTIYDDFEIVIVENNSELPEAFELYKELEASDRRVRVVTWTEAELGKNSGNGEFNYSSIINFGASRSLGDYLCFLNNDTDVVEPGWMTEMVGLLQRSEVGVVGAKLIYEDGLVQHAGLVANGNGDFAHMNRNLPADSRGYENSLALPQRYSMVTGACQMTRRSVFDQLGGYDEGLAVGYNDGDYCLRVGEAGYQVVYTPYAVLHHHEFSSRGRESVDSRLKSRLLSEKTRIMSKHPMFFSSNDPAVNRNLDQFNDWWQLRI